MSESDFQALEQFVEITPVFVVEIKFVEILLRSSEIKIKFVEFVEITYSSTINTCEINVVRKILFAKGGRISKNNTNVACIGVCKPDKVLDDESERNIN